LPLFEEKLQEAADYIAFHLRNPIVAENFIDAVEAAVYERLKARKPLNHIVQRRTANMYTMRSQLRIILYSML
jgi:hypothetical protein